MKQVYLDNSATTAADKNVIEIVEKVMSEDFGNPSSRHMMGVYSEKYLREAREAIAGILKVSEKEIFFTSGGTESNNLALIGAALAGKRAGMHIITTPIEHSSVAEPLKFLKELGFEVTYLPVDAFGHISTDDLKAAVRSDTILVSAMMVNNEIGTLQDIAAIGAAVKALNPCALFHVDAIQAFGKFNIYPKKWDVDLLSVSAHKFHGPKGVGFLYIRKGAKIKPLILGGGQQKGMRSGTDNVPGIAGLMQAAKNAYENLEENRAHMLMLKDRLIDGFKTLSNQRGINIKINSEEGKASAPHIVNATFNGIKSEVMLHALEDKGIYVSSGSACASNRNEPSGTLDAIGLSSEDADSTIRFSFCRYNTAGEIDYTLKIVSDIVPVLSKFRAW